LAQLDSGTKWSGSTITYSFPTSTSGIYTGNGEGGGFSALNSSQQASAGLALTLWDDLISASIQKIAPGASYTSSNIEFGQSSTGVSYAHAYYPGVGSVWFNSAYDATSGTNDLVTPKVGRHGFLTYVHEIGHALGLEHMGDYNGSSTSGPSCYQDSTVYSVMSYYGPSWGSGSANGQGLVAWADWVGADARLYSPQTPMLNDIMAIQNIYGVDTTTRTDNTVYGFNSTLTGAVQAIYDFSQNKNPILTIFDSSGIDTLNLSGWSTSSTVNLARGGFSSCNSMTNNIAIAYTCDIENAVGGSGSDTIYGNTLANTLSGGAGNDVIYGLAGADFINGGAGNDIIDGGEGIDYVIFDADWNSLWFSYDSVTTTVTFSSLLTGTDTITNTEYFTDRNSITHSLDELAGIHSSSVSVAAPTNAVYEGNADSQNFTFIVTLSSASADVQTVDWSLTFGSGRSSADASDFVGETSGTVEFQAGATQATISVQVAGDTTFEGDETFSITLSNPSSELSIRTATAIGTILNDDGKILSGTGSANTLTGTAFADSLYGLGGNDTLYGGGGNDLLDGGLGADVMYGGAGDDIYVVDNSKDRIVEDASGGVDTVRTALSSYVLPTNLENLVYTGASSFTAGGNALANTITGGNGNDVLNGGLGSDTLRGSAGRDAFCFTTALGANNVDRIMDFNAADDTIRLENAIFKSFGHTTGTLAASAFNVGSSASDATDRIIYDPNSGSLYYDPDGTGAAAQVQFAVLVGVTGTLTNADFLII
jgi:serralysin